MTRTCYGPHTNTVTRAERLRRLVTALLTRELMREDIAELLQIGDSGVRKYVRDLGVAIEVARYVDGNNKFPGFPVYRLAMTAEEAQAYLASLEAAPAARPGRPSNSSLSTASREPGRRFHILADDAHYQIRVSRAPVARDALVAAFFGPAPAMEMRA